MKKIENFLKAVNRLKEAVERYKNNRTDDIAPVSYTHLGGVS